MVQTFLQQYSGSHLLANKVSQAFISIKVTNLYHHPMTIHCLEILQVIGLFQLDESLPSCYALAEAASALGATVNNECITVSHVDAQETLNSYMAKARSTSDAVIVGDVPTRNLNEARKATSGSPLLLAGTLAELTLAISVSKCLDAILLMSVSDTNVVVTSGSAHTQQPLMALAAAYAVLNRLHRLDRIRLTIVGTSRGRGRS